MKKFLISVIIIITIFYSGLSAKPCFKVFGYLAGWSNPAGWTLDSIDWDALTHVMDAFAIPNSNGSLDTSNLRLSTLVNKAHLNNTRCLVSIGGQTGSSNFSSICSNPSTRSTFVNNIVNLVTSYGYDGADIDWEFPSSADKANFTALMSELYTAIKNSGNGYDGQPRELTFYTTTGYYDAGVDWANIHNYCDYAIQSGYGWDTYNAPLHDTGTMWTEAGYNIESSMSGFGESIENRGFPTSKWILGLPFFALNGWTETPYGTIKTNGTRTGYDTLRDLGIYNYNGSTYYVNDSDAFAADINYVKQRLRPGIGIWEITQIYPETDLWETIKIQSCGGSPIPTATFTPTPDPAGYSLIDNFEDGEIDVNNRGGAWGQWAADTSSVTRNVTTTDVPFGTYAGYMSGDVIGDSWQSISTNTFLNSSGNPEDLSTYTGLDLYMKGQAGSGTSVSFLIMLVTDNISDSSYWRYKWTPVSTWTQEQIPWLSFEAPSWGEGSTMTLDQILPNVTAIQFAIASDVENSANSVGNEWYWDNIYLYGGTPTSPTSTPTITETPTNTDTFTITYTPSNTPTDTPTPTGSWSTDTPTNTATWTPTSSAPASVLDDFEDGDIETNLWGGLWTTWAASGCSVTKNVTTNSGEGTYAGYMSGDVLGSGWPSIAVSTDLQPSGLAVDLSSTTGLRLYMKGQQGSGTTTIGFLIQLITDNITDYSYWRYQWSPVNTWTYETIPWSSFSAPSWGQGATMDLANDILPHVRAIQFSIADLSGGTADRVGNEWYWDYIEIEGWSPTSTPTNTPGGATDTPTPTNTLSISTDTPTETYTGTQSATDTPTPTPTTGATSPVLDDFEDGDIETNLWGGLWTTWAASGCSVTKNVSTDTGNGSSYSGHMGGDVLGSGWPSIAVSTDLQASGLAMDISNTDGIRLWMKGIEGSGSTGIGFLIQLITDNITDYSYWRYTWSPVNTWTYESIPWSSFSAPSWGQGATMDLANDILPHVRAIQFSIADLSGGVADRVGNEWYWDDIEIYTGGTPTNNTPTFTQTFTNTIISSTNTYTPTLTPIQTSTFTSTPVSNEPTFTPTEADNLEIETPVISYPNPYNGTEDLKIQFKITKNTDKVTFRLYTVASRLINEIIFKSNFSAWKKNEITINRKYLENLSNGTYYYVILISDAENEVRLKRGKIIILR